MSSRVLGYILLTLAMMTVGTTVIASKVVAGSLDPFTATAMRFAIAFPLLAVIMLVSRTPWPRLSAGQWISVVMQAGAGSVGYTVLLITGLQFIDAADAGVIIGILPAVSALFSVTVLGERPSFRIVVSIVLATLGVIVVVWTGATPASLIGSILIFGAVCCESAFILLNKRLTTPIPPLAQSTLMTGFGLGLCLPLVLLEAPLAMPGTDALIAIVYYAIVPTVGGFLLWYAGAARVSGSEAAVFTAIAPLTAVILAGLFLGETIGLAQGLGTAIVVTAVLVLVLQPVRLPTRVTR